MGKSTISMAIFNSYVKWPEGNNLECLGYYSTPKKKQKKTWKFPFRYL